MAEVSQRAEQKKSNTANATSAKYLIRGRSSVVERQLPKLNVVGSIPIARSKNLLERQPVTMVYR